MPFNLSQIFGGWRRKEIKGRKTASFNREKNRGIPPPPPSLTKGGGEGVGYSAPQKSKAATQPKTVKNTSELARKSLIAPHVSEKSGMFGDGRYVFRVTGGATKPQLKNAVEDRYGVNVLSVNIIAPRDKKRRRGANFGIKSGFKKAIIKLKAGEIISEF